MITECFGLMYSEQKDEGVIIVDAGGGTVDLSGYRQTPSGFEEIVTSQCKRPKVHLWSVNQADDVFVGVGQGSVFVGRRAHKYLLGE